MIKQLTRVAILLTSLIFIALPAFAIPYYFSSSTEFGTWDGPLPPGFGFVDVAQTADDIVTFSLSVNTDYFDPDDKGFTWTAFYFNYDGAGSLASLLVSTNDTSGWTIDPVTSRDVSGYGTFDYQMTRDDKDEPGNDPLTLSLQLEGLLASDFVSENLDGVTFVAHLQRLDKDQSTKLAVGPVPEPGTLILIGSGLSGLLLYRRKRRS